MSILFLSSKNKHYLTNNNNHVYFVSTSTGSRLLILLTKVRVRSSLSEQHLILPLQHTVFGKTVKPVLKKLYSFPSISSLKKGIDNCCAASWHWSKRISGSTPLLEDKGIYSTVPSATTLPPTFNFLYKA